MYLHAHRVGPGGPKWVLSGFQWSEPTVPDTIPMADEAPSGDCLVYFGRDLHAIDAKGRVNIPARHRRVAIRRGCIEFWFAPGFDGCVSLWDGKGFQAYSSHISSLPPFLLGRVSTPGRRLRPFALPSLGGSPRFRVSAPVWSVSTFRL